MYLQIQKRIVSMETIRGIMVIFGVVIFLRTSTSIHQGVGVLYSLPSDLILKILTELSFSSVFLPNRYLQKLL